MRESQKGQSIVEFAFILPLLVLFMIGLMYCGLMFSNYVALNDIARDAARSAAMISDTTYKDSGYNTIRQLYQDKYDNSAKSVSIDEYFLPNTTYLWNPASEDQFKIEYVESASNNGEVVVTLTARLNENNGSVGKTFVNVVGGNTIKSLTVTYHMYSEVKH